MRVLAILVSIMIVGCTAVKPANSFLSTCISYAPSTDGKTADETRFIVKKMLECSSNTLQEYCETANCSDVAMEYDRRIVEHKNKIDLLAGAGETAAEIWRMELAQIVDWYEDNETAYTTADEAALMNSLRNAGDAMGEYSRREEAERQRFNEQMNSNRASRPASTTSAGGICSLAAENTIDRFTKVCVYKCMHTTRTKEISGIHSCSSTAMF